MCLTPTSECLKSKAIFPSFVYSATLCRGLCGSTQLNVAFNCFIVKMNQILDTAPMYEFLPSVHHKWSLSTWAAQAATITALNECVHTDRTVPLVRQSLTTDNHQ